MNTATGLAAALEERLHGIELDVDAATVAAASIDTYWKAHALARAGRQPVADVVARPGTVHEVAEILAAASELGVPVIPRGGGSGSQGGAVPDRGGVVIDLGRLNQIRDLNETAGTVHAQAGVLGSDLEAWLNARGHFLPHYPASVHLAQVGGYIAAKGSGVLSTKYGKIEDLVASLEVALPTGEIIQTVPVPRHSVGPDLNQVFIGSEGTMGIVTDATLLVRRIPERRAFRIVGFEDVATGLNAVRAALQAGWRPAVVRLHDEDATRANLARILDIDVSGVKLVLGFDGPDALVEVEQREMLRMLEAAGGQDEGSEIAEAWWENRYRIYYPPYKPELPSIWGTADIVAAYDRILPAYEALRRLITRDYARYGLRFSGHFSHWYLWGTMVYARFMLDDPPEDIDESVALYDEIWRRSSQVVLEHGAVINDHHGVGLKLADYLPGQYGASWEALRRIKRALDPAGVMKPGNLGL